MATYRNKSVYTKLTVVGCPAPGSPPASGNAMMVTAAGELTLDMATYSRPCEKYGLGRKMPTSSKDCPCALMMVMAK